jgi:hypothetical protein
MARFDSSMFGFVFDPISQQFEKMIAGEGEKLLAAHLDNESEAESRERVLLGGASFDEGDLPKTPEGEKLKQQAIKRHKKMAGTGAAVGLTGAKVGKIPAEEKEPVKPSTADRTRALKQEEARQRERDIRQLMEDLNLTREEAEAAYYRQRPRSDRPTA